MIARSIGLILLAGALLMATGCSDNADHNKKNKKISQILEKEYDFDGIIVTEMFGDNDKQVVVQFENFPISSWRMEKLNDFAREVASTTDESYPNKSSDSYFIVIEFLKTSTDHKAVKKVYSAYNFRFHTIYLRNLESDT